MWPLGREQVQWERVQQRRCWQRCWALPQSWGQRWRWELPSGAMALAMVSRGASPEALQRALLRWVALRGSGWVGVAPNEAVSLVLGWVQTAGLQAIKLAPPWACFAKPCGRGPREALQTTGHARPPPQPNPSAFAAAGLQDKWMRSWVQGPAHMGPYFAREKRRWPLGQVN